MQVWDEKIAEDKLLLHFAVSDTGIGIPKEKLTSIFEKFSQADSSTTRKYGGTELGLAIVKQLVLLMSGDVTFRSKENVGSCFEFYVEVGLAIEAEPDQKIVAQYSADDKQSIEILVAEDNPVNQKLISKLLQKLGYSSTIVSNGQEALDACSNPKFQIILMDVQMPVLDGLEATRLIRTTCGEWGRKIPIIGLSAHAFRDAAERSTQQGMTDYLTKPFRATDLQERIERALRITEESESLQTESSP